MCCPYNTYLYDRKYRVNYGIVGRLHFRWQQLVSAAHAVTGTLDPGVGHELDV